MLIFDMPVPEAALAELLMYSECKCTEFVGYFSAKMFMNKNCFSDINYYPFLHFQCRTQKLQIFLYSECKFPTILGDKFFCIFNAAVRNCNFSYLLNVNFLLFWETNFLHFQCRTQKLQLFLYSECKFPTILGDKFSAFSMLHSESLSCKWTLRILLNNGRRRKSPNRRQMRWIVR